MDGLKGRIPAAPVPVRPPRPGRVPIGDASTEEYDKTETITARPTADVLLEVLFLDEETCDPCRTTVATVDRLAAEMEGSLGAAGRTVEVRKIHVTDPEQARQLGFVTSPTGRVWTSHPTSRRRSARPAERWPANPPTAASFRGTAAPTRHRRSR